MKYYTFGDTADSICRSLNTIFFPMFQTLQQDIATHRDQMIKLDKNGTHLKYFSQKPDVIIIKNLLSSVQQRWEKIVSRSAERTRHLERGYKEAKQVEKYWWPWPNNPQIQSQARFKIAYY